MDVRKPEAPDQPSWLYMVLIAVTLAVAAIPEGIPLCVTISLSTGCSDMVKKNVLVRRIAAVETLGCASVICTDKTGTLTEGKMTMVAMHAGGNDFVLTGKGFDPTQGGIFYESNKNENLIGDSKVVVGSNNNAVEKAEEMEREREQLKKGNGMQNAAADPAVVAALSSALLCSNTKIVEERDEDAGDDNNNKKKKGEETEKNGDGESNSNGTKWVPYGNSSEAPIVVAAAKIGLWGDALEEELPRLFEVPFSSSRKMMLTVTSLDGTTLEMAKARDNREAAAAASVVAKAAKAASAAVGAVKDDEDEDEEKQQKTRTNQAGSDDNSDFEDDEKKKTSVARAKHLFPLFYTPEQQQPTLLANVKGAPNYILDLCDHWLSPDGNQRRAFTAEDRKRTLDRVDELSSRALRVLAVAARPMATQPFPLTSSDSELDTDEKFSLIVKQPGLTFLGLVASIDPERDGVRDAVIAAHE